MKSFFSSLLATLITTVLPYLAAQEATTNSKPPTLNQMSTWVEDLANRDPKPFEERYVLKPPRKVDRDSLNIVKKAYDNLSANVTNALPALIASLDDDRYSYYQESPSGAFLCHTVGDACYSIIVANVEIYRRHATVLDRTERPRTVHFISAMGGPKKWLSTRTDKSLYEMQLEAIEWAMIQSKPDPQKLVAEGDWKKSIDELKTFHEIYKRTAKPLTENNELWFEGK